jgi:TonB-linked SusC/RagA family outer membrane protein
MKKFRDYYGRILLRFLSKKTIRVMKLTLLLSMFTIIQLWATESYSQLTKLTLMLEDVKISDALKEIENHSEFFFLYSPKLIDVERKVNLDSKNEPIEDILNNLFEGKVKFAVYDRQVILTPNEQSELLSAFQQQNIITGIVTEENGSSIPGVNVTVTGTTRGTITDISGKYSIDVPKGSKSLTFTFVGMEPQEITIGALSQINVIMTVSAIGLEEVVVTALGIKRQTKALGFAQQELGTNALSASRETNLTSFLTGKVAGVQVSKTASGTGGSSAITIRGAKSLLGNNQPLFVVDGIPITNIGHNSGGTFEGNDLGDGIGDINPEDVESMSVLKGPNASALYGARGSNGVILITTKSGQKKKGIGVEINSNTSFETLNLIPTYQNYYGTGYEETNLYGDLKVIGGKTYETIPTWHGDSWGPPLDGSRTVVDPFVYPADANTRTLVLLPQPADNVRDFYETGVNTANTVSISGSNEKTSARLSIGNTTNKGIIPNTKLSKQTVVLSANSQLTDYLSFDGKMNYIHDEGYNRPGLGQAFGGNNVTNVFVTMGRYVPMSWLKEYYETTKLPGKWPGVSYNPYFIVNELKNHDTKDRIIGQVSATLKLAPWLSLLGRAGTDFYTQKQVQTWPIGSMRSENIYGRVYNILNIVKDVNADVILTANKAISSRFNLNASLGSSILYQERNNQEIDGRNFKAPGVYDVSNCQEIRPSTYLSRKEMQSVYFMGQVAYANYLFLDVTGRNDWSSALGINNYSFFYPSVSTSFVFTDAFKSIPTNILSFGKVRASWAQVGNDSDPYLTKNGYISTTTTYAGQGLSYMDLSIPLFNLKNELTESWEIGSDLRFLNNRIGLDLTYYNGKTTNQIVPVNVSNSSGYTAVVINAGEIQNKGIEIALNLTPVKTSTAFSWDINANFSRNRSKVVSLAQGIESLPLADGGGGCYIEARLGQAYGNIIGYAYKRSPDGQKIVSDGYYVRTEEQQILGNITPDWIGGLNNILSYKGLTLNFLLDFVQGNEISSTTKYQMEAKGTGNWTVEGRVLHDTKNAEGTIDYIGILSGVKEVKDGAGNVTSYVKNDVAVNGQNYWATRAWNEISEEFVLDGSYISLREVMLGYNFSPSFLKKTPLAGITVSVIGRNLMYLEEHMQGMGISPESAPNTSSGYAGTETISMPTTRTWGFNVKLNF